MFTGSPQPILVTTQFTSFFSFSFPRSSVASSNPYSSNWGDIKIQCVSDSFKWCSGSNCYRFLNIVRTCYIPFFSVVYLGYNQISFVVAWMALASIPIQIVGNIHTCSSKSWMLKNVIGGYSYHKLIMCSQCYLSVSKSAISPSTSIDQFAKRTNPSLLLLPQGAVPQGQGPLSGRIFTWAAVGCRLRLLADPSLFLVIYMSKSAHCLCQKHIPKEWHMFHRFSQL